MATEFSPLQRLEQIAKTSKRTEKIRLLKKYPDQVVLRALLDIALNPYRIFGLGTIEPPSVTHGKKFSDQQVAKQIIEWASAFEKYTNRADKLSKLHDYMKHCSSLQRKWIIGLLTKEPRLGASSSTINTAIATKGFRIPTFDVQLALPSADLKEGLEKLPFKEYIMEPKLNGLRLLITPHAFSPKERVLLSRNGHPLSADALETVEQQVMGYKPLQPYVIDGELCVIREDGTNDWSKSVSIARSFVNIKDATSLVYYVFDCIPRKEWDPSGLQHTQHRKTWEQRHKVLEDVLGNAKLPNVQLLPFERCRSYKHVMDTYADCVAGGYEGIMLKHRKSTYEYKRNASWIKIKPEETEDLEIVGFNEGNGRLKGTLGSLDVTRKNVVTSVSGIPDAMRDFIWENRDSLMGTMVEVSYQMLSPDKKLLFPRFKRLRPDK